ncbi:methyl-accepting chemotaxis protein [Paenibacillus sp. JX-17]|uniref:Methyl-accepting chemotaxis protein n=1 Tax=Paenibacillus lacisoli TaxID=3064525 RepID=A0ABT9CDL7_9BACL|nr:methyl-accepting chemotaxis protein [Paenibacillus sp. JX-17]MDO7907342.1 methyl-accepting chemotaxis protein [Paenibacillus sp. JX-17]
MNRLDEIIWRRNKLIMILMWVISAVGIGLAFMIPQLWISNIVSIVFNSWVTYCVIRRKHTQLLPWLITALLIAVIVYLSIDSANLILGLVVGSMLLFYPRRIFFAIGFGVTVVVDAVQMFILSPDPTPEGMIGNAINLGMFIIAGAALMVVSHLNYKLYLESERRWSEVEQSKRQVESMFERVQEAAAGLGSYTEQMKRKVTNTGTITSEVTMGFMEVAKGVEFQASSVSEISESLSVSDLHIREVAANSKEMKELSSTMASVTEVGSSSMDHLNSRMSELYEVILNMAKEMQDFNRESESMTTILNGISAISKQTNLLALNAAIESARAGEHGRGFAVVAGEVRKLAEHSGQSAQEISDILLRLQRRTLSLTERFEGVRESLAEGRAAVQTADEVFRTINANTQQVLNQASEIENSSVTMEESSRKVVGEVTEISGVTEQSSAAAEQILASMEEQHNITKEMVDSFSELEQLILSLNDLVFNHSGANAELEQKAMAAAVVMQKKDQGDHLAAVSSDMPVSA